MTNDSARPLLRTIQGLRHELEADRGDITHVITSATEWLLERPATPRNHTELLLILARAYTKRHQDGDLEVALRRVQQAYTLANEANASAPLIVSPGCGLAIAQALIDRHDLARRTMDDLIRRFGSPEMNPQNLRLIKETLEELIEISRQED